MITKSDWAIWKQELQLHASRGMPNATVPFTTLFQLVEAFEEQESIVDFRLEDLKEEVDEANRTIDSLEADLIDAENDNNDLQEVIAGLREDIRNLEAENFELTHDNEALRESFLGDEVGG